MRKSHYKLGIETNSMKKNKQNRPWINKSKTKKGKHVCGEIIEVIVFRFTVWYEGARFDILAKIT